MYKIMCESNRHKSIHFYYIFKCHKEKEEEEEANMFQNLIYCRIVTNIITFYNSPFMITLLKARFTYNYV